MINQSQAANTGGLLEQLQLKPTSEASQRYLANHVGQIQRAVVVDVSPRQNTSSSKRPQSNQFKTIIYDVVLKLGSHKITVESPLVPRLGQQLDIQIVNHQQIKLLKVLDKQASLESYNQSQASLNEKPATVNKSALPPISQSTPSLAKSINSQQQAIILNSLRRHLPRTNDIHTVSSLNVMLDKLPNINNAISTSIMQLYQSINPLSHLVDPLRLSRTIKNSGLLFESKLNRLLSAGEKITVDQLLSLGLLVNADKKHKKTTDYKLSLLHLITVLKSHLDAETQVKNTPISSINLDELWNTVTALISRSDLANNNIANRNQEILPLLRLLLSLVSRVQSQQLTTLSQQQSTGDNTSSLLFELPVWIDQKISTLELRLQWSKDTGSIEDSKNQRVWSAKLSFDCGEAGHLISMISLRGKKCAALFCAPNDDIKTKVSRSLDGLNQSLTQQGMVVDKLQCVLDIPKNNSDSMLITNLLDTSI